MQVGYNSTTSPSDTGLLKLIFQSRDTATCCALPSHKYRIIISKTALSFYQRYSYFQLLQRYSYVTHILTYSLYKKIEIQDEDKKGHHCLNCYDFHFAFSMKERKSVRIQENKKNYDECIEKTVLMKFLGSWFPSLCESKNPLVQKFTKNASQNIMKQHFYQ